MILKNNLRKLFLVFFVILLLIISASSVSVNSTQLPPPKNDNPLQENILFFPPDDDNGYVTKKVKTPMDVEWKEKINAHVGDLVDFKITVTAAGYYPMEDVSVYDYLPLGIELVSANPVPEGYTIEFFYNPSDGYLNYFYIYHWSFSNIHQGETKTILLNTKVVDFPLSNNYCFNGTNVAVLEATEYSNGCHNAVNYIDESDSAEVEVFRLGLLKYVYDDCGPGPYVASSPWKKSTTVYEGEIVKFRLLTGNTGSQILTNVIVEDTLPYFLVYNVGSANYTPSYYSDHFIRWNLGNLDVGEIVEIIFTATAICEGEADNVAIATSLEVLQVRDTAHVIVIQKCKPELCVSKEADIDVGNPGDIVKYTIIVENTGCSELFNVWINDTTLDISYYVDVLKSKESRTFYVEHILDCCEDPFINKVCAEGYDKCGKYYHDCDNETVDVICDEKPEISLEKYVAWDCQNNYQKQIDTQIGEYVKFKIYVNNTGETPLYNIVITDTLPLGLTYEQGSATPAPSDINGNTLTWEIPFLDIDDGVVIQFRTENIEECGFFENIADVTATDKQQNTVTDSDKAFVNVECLPPPKPCLKYNPPTLDFGYMHGCEEATKTFEIWNGCEGTLEYSLNWDCGWITEVTPTTGSSTGEHDTISVKINTALLHWGDTYTCQIHITSNGGNGTVNVTVTIGDEPEPDDPYLDYSPKSCYFGIKEPGQTDSTTFEIWNGNSGTLTYTLSEDCSWVELSATNGESTGEHDVITVDIDTTGLSEGIHTCNVEITSNGGSGTYFVNVTVQEPAEPQPPTIEIIKPKEKMLYFRNNEGRAFLLSLIIGPITIQANAEDTDGEIRNVEFYINGVLKHNVTEGPYNYDWNERAFGFRTITVKAYDTTGLMNSAEIRILIFNRGKSK